jgi:hypothetical protein
VMRGLAAEPVSSDAPLHEARTALRAAEEELAVFLEAVSAADLGVEAFARAARVRRDAVDAAKGEVERLMASRPPAVSAALLEEWERMSDGQRNRLLRSVIEVVLVARAGGRGRIVPIESRVRVIRAGAGLVMPYRGGGVPRPNVPVALPDPSDPRVLGV